MGKAAANANYGGQAVLEGVMIRGPRSLAVAVRRIDGRIVLKREPLVPLTRRHPLLNLPFLRGAFALVDALLTGMRALRFSADVAMEEENERLAQARAAVEAPPAGEDTAERPGEEPGNRLPLITHPSPPDARAEVEVREVAAGQGIPTWSLVPTMLLTFAIVAVVFIAVPDALANVLRGPLPPGRAANALINLVEGLVRIGFFVAYILAISRMEVIGRVFQYHGAEHQVIYAFENGDPVTPAAARRYDTAHPRCGTSFVAVVVLVSILAFSFLDIEALPLRLLAKLALLPVIGGLSYEVIRLAGAGRLTFLVLPGLWLQRLTTRRPDAEQLAVAIAALEGALEQEGRSLHRAAEATGD